MKALIIASQERYEKFMPKGEFVDTVEKIYVPMGTPVSEMPKEAFEADFIGADAIAKVPAELIDKMPNLKIIHSEGVAFNGIDLEAATKRHIYVCNNKGINAVAVAEQSIMLMLGLLRTVIPGYRAVRQGKQIQMKEQRMMEGIAELADCKIGLVGFGDIAKAVAKLLQPFGCQVFYYTKIPKGPNVEKEYQVTWLPLERLIETCDIISLHVPVTEETTNMVDEEFLRKMKKTAYLINTARGEIVDNQALRKALIEGWIAGAGLDTIAPEPVQADNPLVDLPEEVLDKVLFAPHLGGITTSTFRRAHKNIWRAFEAVANDETPEHIVNLTR